MAMLAEPRQRKRYNLVPRGKALYEDDSRFGTKMLEKMGWSKGKGLGANEDGTQDFVRVRYKNDIEGLGFEQRDDQWTQHESSFSGLLKSLNGENSEGVQNGNQQSAESEDEIPRVGFGFQSDKTKECTKKVKRVKLKEEISGISLEEKSKQSKARVHYKKFTKGKDLSQYSEKDLANIFGKKAVTAEGAAETDIYQQINTEVNEKEKDVSEKFSGVQTISTGLSVSDYFKMKMAALKNRKSLASGELEESVDKDATDLNTTSEVVESRKKKKKKSHSVECEDIEESEKQGTENLVEDSVDIPSDKKQKKKKKRSKEKSADVAENQEVEECPNDSHKKKKSKEKRDAENNSQSATIIESKNTKLKKTKSLTQTLPDLPISEDNLADCSIEETDKKRKNKSKKRLHSDTQEDSTTNKPAKKTKRDSVSDSKQQQTNVDNITDLQANLSLFNVYRLSSFCAEKFRNLNLSYFPKSSLSQIEGYGLNRDVQLKIETIKTDEMRITRLWDNTLSKYALVEKETNKAYQKYVKETYKARKQKQKRPTLHFKTWKRKNAFAII